MTPRYFKCFKIKSIDNLLVEYGVINRNQPEVLFVSCKTYITSQTKRDLNETLNNILLRARKVLKQIIINLDFEEDFIFDYTITQGLEQGFKNKIILFDIFVKQKNNNIIPPSKLKKHIKDISEALGNYLNDKCNAHKCFLSKTKH